MEITSTKDLLAFKLNTFYDVEQQIAKALPRMVENASGQELKQLLSEHQKETENQASRIKDLLSSLGVELSEVSSQTIQSLISEEEKNLEQVTDSTTMDMAIIGGAQKVEHFEIAGYEDIGTLAKLLGETETILTIEQICSEEKLAAEKLRLLALRQKVS